MKTAHRFSTSGLNAALRKTGASAVIAALAIAATGATQAADLTISLNELGKPSGRVMLNILRNEAQMNNAEPAMASMMLSPSDDGVSVTLHDIAAGTYGVQVMHDENGNGELDANMLGIPKEPWGFSNNAKGKFGPPKWDDVKFTIDAESVVQTISLNN